ncbi:hypothetical protein ACFWU5_16435 [Nocardia sp. NPDC058640]|uniref:DUF7341 domain-containing protein n=1 Tax=Nocardia sp. NPDC058640 TaxID=3346571 RepID=UPI00364E606B
MNEPTELVAGARNRFVDATHALIGLRLHTVTLGDSAKTTVLDSLYTELQEARHGEQAADARGHTVPGSRPPVWTDAISLLDEIDRAVATWWPHTPPADGTAVTTRRLHALADYPWAPDDVAVLRRMTRHLNAWTDRIRQLLVGERVWELKAPCPVCGETTVIAVNGAGEHVRRTALQVTVSGARCIGCEATWAPEKFQALGAAIGVEGFAA